MLEPTDVSKELFLEWSAFNFSLHLHERDARQIGDSTSELFPLAEPAAALAEALQGDLARSWDEFERGLCGDTSFLAEVLVTTAQFAHRSICGTGPRPLPGPTSSCCNSDVDFAENVILIFAMSGRFLMGRGWASQLRNALRAKGLTRLQRVKASQAILDEVISYPPATVRATLTLDETHPIVQINIPISEIKPNARKRLLTRAEKLARLVRSIGYSVELTAHYADPDVKAPGGVDAQVYASLSRVSAVIVFADGGRFGTGELIGYCNEKNVAILVIQSEGEFGAKRYRGSIGRRKDVQAATYDEDAEHAVRFLRDFNPGIRARNTKLMALEEYSPRIDALHKLVLEVEPALFDDSLVTRERAIYSLSSPYAWFQTDPLIGADICKLVGHEYPGHPQNARSPSSANSSAHATQPPDFNPARKQRQDLSRQSLNSLIAKAQTMNSSVASLGTAIDLFFHGRSKAEISQFEDTAHVDPSVWEYLLREAEPNGRNGRGES